MINWNKYQHGTQDKQPSPLVQKALQSVKTNKKLAIDLGCGSGADTLYLLKMGWRVIAIDGESYGLKVIKKRSEDYATQVVIKEARFEKLPPLQKSDLFVANFSLPFCSQGTFRTVWESIQQSLIADGLFVGTFFGKKDGWFPDETMTFFEISALRELFSNFQILQLKEIEDDVTNPLEEAMHHDYFEVIARKR